MSNEQQKTFYTRAKAYLLDMPPGTRGKIASCSPEHREEFIKICIDLITNHPRGWQYTFDSREMKYIIRRDCPADFSFGQYCGYEPKTSL